MPLFSVDPQKCKRDGICAAACPMKIIDFAGDGSPPRPASDAEELCIACGHCVAVCPHGAMFHREMAPDACPPMGKDWPLSPGAIAGLMRGRRSIRAFRGRPVEHRLVEALIGLAACAPSAHNRQPVRWIVISGVEQNQRIAGLVIDWMRSLIADGSPLAETLHMARTVSQWESGHDPIARRTPCLVVAHAAKEERLAAAACTIALTYLELAAPAYGLGACWAGYINTAANLWRPLLQALGLPESHLPFGAMMLGYPKYAYYRVPKRNAPSITWC